VAQTNLHLGYGTKQSNNGFIRRRAFDPDRQSLLTKEIGAMKPNLVLCGNTFESALESLSVDVSAAPL
jgi:hypothetical protein